MRDISCLDGVNELNDIKKYALGELIDEERQFIEKIDKFPISYLVSLKLQEIWYKYEYLRPFLFLSDPANKIPRVFQNREAFIIWTAWRAKHLLGQAGDLEAGSLAAAKALSRYKPRFSDGAKKGAVKAFQRNKHGFEAPFKDELEYWNREIFPYLEGAWEFKWEIRKNRKSKVVDDDPGDSGDDFADPKVIY